MSQVYSMADVIVEVDIAPESATETYEPIANVTTMTMASNNTIETWVPANTGGKQKALKITVGKTMTLDGKRTKGDPGNDYIFSLDNKVGMQCNTKLRFTFPKDGTGKSDQLVYPCVIDVTGMMGATTAVGILSFSAISDGEWTWSEVTTP